MVQPAIEGEATFKTVTTFSWISCVSIITRHFSERKNQKVYSTWMDQTSIKNQKYDQRSGMDQVAGVESAWKRLIENKDEENERTFCYQLFEERHFNNHLFLTMCNNMDLVLAAEYDQTYRFKILVWIISCTFRSVFSHVDEKDLYRIDNFDAEIAEKWRDEYLEKLRELLAAIFSKVAS